MFITRLIAVMPTAEFQSGHWFVNQWWCSVRRLCENCTLGFRTRVVVGTMFPPTNCRKRATTFTLDYFVITINIIIITRLCARKPTICADRDLVLGVSFLHGAFRRCTRLYIITSKAFRRAVLRTEMTIAARCNMSLLCVRHVLSIIRGSNVNRNNP